MKKKIAWLMLTVLVVSAILPGCGKKEEDPATTEAESTQPTETIQEQAEPVLADEIVVYDNMRLTTTKANDPTVYKEEIIGDNIYYYEGNDFNAFSVLCFNNTTYIKFKLGDDEAKFKLSGTDNIFHDNTIKDYNDIIQALLSCKYAGDNYSDWIFYANGDNNTIYSLMIPKGAEPFAPSDVVYTVNGEIEKSIVLEPIESFSTTKYDLTDCVEISKSAFNIAYKTYLSQAELITTEETAQKFHQYLIKKYDTPAPEIEDEEAEVDEDDKDKEDDEEEDKDKDDKDAKDKDKDSKKDDKDKDDADEDEDEEEPEESEAEEETIETPAYADQPLLTRLFIDVIKKEYEARKEAETKKAEEERLAELNEQIEEEGKKSEELSLEDITEITSGDSSD